MGDCAGGCLRILSPCMEAPASTGASSESSTTCTKRLSAFRIFARLGIADLRPWAGDLKKAMERRKRQTQAATRIHHMPLSPHTSTASTGGGQSRHSNSRHSMIRTEAEALGFPHARPHRDRYHLSVRYSLVGGMSILLGPAHACTGPQLTRISDKHERGATSFSRPGPSG